MAFVSMGSTHVTGAVAGQDITEGYCVELSVSGIHADLPTALVAASGAKNVFIAIMSPDQFPRPTPAGMFARPWNSSINPRNATEFLIDSGQRGPYYLISPSLLTAPVIASGWMLQCHKGGAYTLQAGAFHDSASIRSAGATVCVGASGKLAYSTSNVVGYVREYRDGKLIVVLDQRSA